LCVVTVAPVIVEPLKDAAVALQKTAKFVAKVNLGKPPAQTVWFKDGEALTLAVFGTKYFTASTAEVASLLIDNCELSDAGEYSVTVSNVAGSVSSEAKLTVHGKLLQFHIISVIKHDCYCELDMDL
jgi:Immunoglobulin I-set domain